MPAWQLRSYVPIRKAWNSS